MIHFQVLLSGDHGLKYNAFIVLNGVATPMRIDLPQRVDKIWKTKMIGLPPRVPTSYSGQTSEPSLPAEFG